MTLLAALAGSLTVIGLWLIARGLRPRPQTPPPPARPRVSLVSRVVSMKRGTRIRLAIATVIGIAAALVTGWVVLVVLVPAVFMGMPVLLSTPSAAGRIHRLDAMADWTRSLSGTLRAGSGLEDSIKRSVRTCPDPIRPEVEKLVRRMNAYVSTSDALRQFADDLDDPTGDLLAANLIQASALQGVPLTDVLDQIADSIGQDVSARRRIEADRNRPRTVARTITVITIGIIAAMFSTPYAAPLRTPAGGVVFLLELLAFVATLVWLRRMSAIKDAPRFLDSSRVPTGAMR